MSEYIKKSEAYRLLENEGDSLTLRCSAEVIYKAADMISCMKSADVKPVVHAKWKNVNPVEVPLYRCSACGRTPTVIKTNFCPECGADMRGDNEHKS